MLISELENEVLKLDEIEKIRLLEIIFESLEKPDTKIQDTWINESEKRYLAFQKGKTKSVTFEDIMKRLQQ
ncbi:addiction module protein [candidate division KSB1 bacterium]|nr:addiction module protein [candidate division KSB1 bacterium]